MKYCLEKKREGFWRIFKKRKTTCIKYRRTIGHFLYLGNGYKTKLSSDEEIMENGELKNLVEVLTKKGEGLKVPFGIPWPEDIPEGYVLHIEGTGPEIRANKTFLEESKRKSPEKSRDLIERINNLVGEIYIDITRKEMRIDFLEPSAIVRPFFKLTGH